MKNGRTLLLVALSSMLTLVGCGGNESQSKKSSSSDGHYITEDTEITVWTTFNDDYGAVIEGVINSVQTAEPKLKINYVKQSASYDGLKDMAVAGFSTNTYPDVVVAYPDSVADFINGNKALAMDSYMNNEEYGWTQEDKEDIFEAYIDEGQHYAIEGTYSLPLTKSTEALYWNKKVLLSSELVSELAGYNITMSEEYMNRLTWDELFDKLCPALLDINTKRAADKKIIITDGDADWAVCGYDSDDNLFITLAEQYGYGYTSLDQYGNGKLDFNNPQMKALMKKFAGYVDKHYFTTKGVLGTNTNYRSCAGEMLMTVGSTGGIKYQYNASYMSDVGVSPIPQASWDQGRVKIINQGPSLAFLDHDSENRALGSWLFYKAWTTASVNAQWAMTSGYSPIRRSVLEDDAYIEYADVSKQQPDTQDLLYARNATYAATVGAYLFASPVFVGSSTARTQVGGLTTEILSKPAADRTDAFIDSVFKAAYDNTIIVM